MVKMLVKLPNHSLLPCWKLTFHPLTMFAGNSGNGSLNTYGDNNFKSIMPSRLQVELKDLKVSRYLPYTKEHFLQQPMAGCCKWKDLEI